MQYSFAKLENAIEFNMDPDDTPAAIMIEMMDEYISTLKAKGKPIDQIIREIAKECPDLHEELIKSSGTGDISRATELLKEHPEMLDNFMESMDDDENETLKETLNSGIGSPGETTRVLSHEYKKIRQRVNRKEACREVLTNRAMTYSTMGMEVINQDFLERILTKADGEFPIVIFADIYAANNYPPYDRVELVLENLDLLVEVIIENYNCIVDSIDNNQWLEGFKFKVKEFVNEEYKKDIFEIKNEVFFNEVWSYASSFPEKDSEVWRKDVFGAWICKDDYNKSNPYGWKIIALQKEGLYLPFHFLNTERDENDELLCRVVANGKENIVLKKP